MWKKIISESGGSADLSKLTNLNFRTSNDVLEIKTPNKTANNGFVTFIDDDCRIGAYTKLIPLFESRGVKLNMACATGWIDQLGEANGMPLGYDQYQYMSWEQIREVQNNGHEILGHSVHHKTHNTLTDAAQIAEFVDCKKRLVEEGIAVSSYVYPGNAYNTFTLKNVVKYYRSAFRGGGTSNKPPLGYSILNRVTLGIGEVPTATQAIKDKILAAKTNGEWVSLMSHIDHTDASWTEESTLALVTEILDYCIANGVEVLTVREALRRMGDVWTVGQNEVGGESYYVLGADKNIYTNIEHLPTRDTVKFKPSGTYNGSELPSTFVNSSNVAMFYECNFTSVQASGNANLPVTIAGTLITEMHNALDTGYTKQIYKVYNSGDVYERYATGSNTWGSWKKVVIGEQKDIIVNIPAIDTVKSLTVDVNFGSSLSGKNILVTPVTALSDDFIWSYKTVSTSLNMVKVTLFNSGASTLTPGNVTFRVLAI